MKNEGFIYEEIYIYGNQPETGEQSRPASRLLKEMVSRPRSLLV